jgi:cell division protein FtsN
VRLKRFGLRHPRCGTDVAIVSSNETRLEGFMKFGLLILLALFGASAFAAGVLAPDHLATTVRRQVEAAQRSSLGRYLPNALTPTASAPAELAVPSYQQLLPEGPSSAGRKYALQVGSFTNAEGAAEGRAELDALGYQAQVVYVERSRRFIVVTGSYDTRQIAYAEQSSLRALLDQHRVVRLIRLPESKK